MPPNSATPKLVLGSDSPRAGADLQTPIKAAIHTNPSENGLGNIYEDRRYDVLDSPVNSKPPLSRNPTEVGTGIRIATPSSLQASGHELSSGIQRSKTEAPVRASAPSQPNGPNPNKRRTRSYAEGGVSSRKSKQEADLAAQITSAMDRMGEIGLDDPKSYLPDGALSGLITENRIKRALSRSSEKLIASSELINFAKTNPKVLAITVLVYSDKRSRYQAMEAFRSNGFGDHCLPVIMFSEKVCFVQFQHNDSDESDQSDDESEISEPLENDSEDESDILETSGAASEPPLQCKHRSEADAFHSAPWTSTTFRTFFEKQWSFLVRRFEHHVFEYHEIREKEILPFEYKNGNDGNENDNTNDDENHNVVRFENRVASDGSKVPGGHFGDVRLRVMLANYQTAIPTNQPTIPVAIKEMKVHTGEEYNNFENWQRETTALKIFNRFHSQHIVRGIGAFKYHGKYYILMEWADGGDLEKMWSKNPSPHLDLTAAKVAQFLKQFRELANALNSMHNYKPDGQLPGQVLPKEEENETKPSMEAERLIGIKLPNNTGQSSGLKVPGNLISKPMDLEIMEPTFVDHESSGGTTKSKNSHDQHVHFEDFEMEVPEIKVTNDESDILENWRHGDLKPANIVSFAAEDSSSWLGTLKLADLGRARQHLNKTAKRRNTVEQFTTYPYDPPEVWAGLSGRSRGVDIWSFGCVLLESLIWLFFGLDELFVFQNRTITFGSLYWSPDSMHRKTAKRNVATFDWMKDLLVMDPECQPSGRESALRDLVQLITDKLLVIQPPDDYDVYQKGCRINCKSLVTELDRIIDRGEQDPSYLFSGHSREEVTAPQLPQGLQSDEGEKENFLTTEVRLTGANVNQRRVAAPWEARPLHGSNERVDSYIHDFEDKWHYVDDIPFASRMLQRPTIDISKLLPKETSSVLCDICELVDFNSPNFEIKCSLGQLRRRKEQEGCELCSLLLRAAERDSDRDWVEFDISESGIRVNGNPGLPALIIRRTEVKDEGASSSNTTSMDIQIGFPRIPKGGSLAHFDIMQAWLDDCDKDHKECRVKRPNSVPTRVIDVGSIESPSLRLVESASLPEKERKSMRYIALSYPWGTDPPHQHFVTDKSNVDAHREEIPNKLPQTLADAITTTRHLNIRYLWIDSVCIIQGPGGDFAEEADRMETVFSSAYCVIAATSADGSTSGFLKRTSKRELDAVVDSTVDAQNPVWFQDQEQNGKLNTLLFVDEPFDDFEGDVLKGPLNQRGWVFQERALARRTIHFTNNQTYWECGDGIRCESLTKMKNTRVGFLSDPNFPSFGMQGSKGGDIVFYEDLYEQYSKLSFSKIEDRPFAISGLEQRLTQALKEKGGSDRGYWGIFDDYWGRGLLWHRASGVDKMIRLTRGATGGDPAPSWSWEGFSGGITFMKPEPRTVEWLSTEVTLPWSRIHNAQSRMTTASYHGERSLRGLARDFTPGKTLGTNLNDDIIYDDKVDCLNRGPLKVLIIGRLKMEGRSREQVRNYVLILARKNSTPEDVYERIGAGILDGALIRFEKEAKSVRVE